ncbi:YfbM family protein [Paenibacillus sp. WLX2291]|uniref:YfbM family protein n=1 Tax=Paenibacillus sp. WLX2291 TaxID=3296934 RepID=UPI0039842197
MGMTGKYLAVDSSELEKLVQGQWKVDQLDVDHYPELDIDKSWQGIHLWLCRDYFDGQPPQGYVVPMLKDQALELEPYGAYYLYPQQVQQAAEWLAASTDEQLASSYDFASMMEQAVYPTIEGEDEQEFYDYLHAHLRDIQTFYQIAVTTGHGIVFYVF